MICRNCGYDVQGRNFCPQCGTPVTQAPANVAPARQNTTLGNPTQVLVFGILGLALGLSTGVVGLIFSIIALSKASNYIATYGPVSTQVNTGRSLAIAGLVVSIVITLFWVIFFIAFAANFDAIMEGVSKAAESSRLREQYRYYY